jgi:hypothetical protein
MMEQPNFSETSVPIYQNTRTYLPKYMAILLSITNKMQLYKIFFIAVNVVNVSGGFSA